MEIEHLFFEEIIQTIETEETGSFIKREVIYVEYDSGCFKDDGEMVVLTQERVKELENELHNLLKIMKTVKELYEELNRVVVNKLLSNEYTFVSQTTSVVRLKIDNLPFTFWTGYYGTYFSSYGDFGESNVLDVKFTEEEEKKRK